MTMRRRARTSPFIHINDAANKKPGIVCEPFHVLSYYIGCPYQCSYCYLQCTFRGKVAPVVYTNRDKLLAELDEWLKKPGTMRLNAGELEDSLALDGFIPLVDDLVPRFLRQKRHKLLLVTKSANVRNLLKYKPNGNVMVAFSVNPPAVAEKFERGAPHPYRRLQAARLVKEAGYPVTFRLDPMLPVPGWQDAYGRFIETAYSFMSPDQWTLSSLRFFPSLPMWTAKVGRSTDVYNFGVKRCPEDGRYRLPEQLRLGLYKHAMRAIRRYDSRVIISLCKETRAIHRKLGLRPEGCCYAKIH